MHYLDGPVLVTGVSGFLGAHILHQLLIRKFVVRGTVRSQEKLTYVRQRYPDQSQLSLEIVEDVALEGALDKALKDISAVIHVASPFSLSPKDNEGDLILPAVNGTLNVLRGAARTPSVSRVILTSTMAAMSHIGSGPIPGKIYNEADWNPVTWDQAVASPDGHYVYCASKKFAEQFAWKFMEVENPHFDLISINPAWLIGPFIHHVGRFLDLNESLRECYLNLERKEEALPPTNVQYWVDVRDAAEAHVLALEHPKANGRYLVVNRDKFDWKKAFNSIRQRFPDKLFPKNSEEYYIQSRPDVDPSKAEKEFGFGWTPLAETFGDMYAQFYELQDQNFLQ